MVRCENSRQVPSKIRNLHPFEEAVGVLNWLNAEKECLLACIGKVNLVLPLGMEEPLKIHLNKKIGLLRLDDQYFVRAIPSSKNSASNLVQTASGDGYCLESILADGA